MLFLSFVIFLLLFALRQNVFFIQMSHILLTCFVNLLTFQLIKHSCLFIVGFVLIAYFVFHG